MKITYVQHANIDIEKWDYCIESAANGLIYAYSYYLDAMSKNWDALVMNDYEAVMPLTWNRKLGISYLRQPAFTQQLGIFGNLLITEKIVNEFTNKASELFPFAEINLNYANENIDTGNKKCNLVLDLNNPFIEIEKSFKKDLIKNIKKAKRSHLIYEATEEIETAIESYIRAYSARFHTSEKDYPDFLQLCFLLKSKGQIFVRKVTSKNKQLLAIAIFLKDRKRIYNIMSTTFPEGRNREANHFLLYQLIKEFSEHHLILDFEGSEIPSIQSFYKKFGAIEQPYPFVKINKLPFGIKWIKSIYDYLKPGYKESGR
ncbi:MAG: GNAT family N-acetyltransferase [Bacteroidota bacterium]|nr:GNAT family N-acetyltransferase [Bacteroidota bacterium]